ncbi:Uncharacterised protein [Mycobacteroides abscessus subsp. abscessus]|nr:Uncharacterised protein [Mycobacteroides abscessus subsp. abscessus]
MSRSPRASPRATAPANESARSSQTRLRSRADSSFSSAESVISSLISAGVARRPAGDPTTATHRVTMVRRTPRNVPSTAGPAATSTGKTASCTRCALDAQRRRMAGTDVPARSAMARKVRSA